MTNPPTLSTLGSFSSLNTGAQADWVVTSVGGGTPIPVGSSGFTESAGAVSALAVDSFGGLYAGHIGLIYGLDEWPGGPAWSGIINSGINGNVNALVFDGSGNLYAGGASPMRGCLRSTTSPRRNQPPPWSCRNPLGRIL